MNGLEIRKLLVDEIKKAVVGKDEVIVKAIAAIMAGGHILLEDIPGVGKTTLAMAISKTMNLKYNRMQFTSDVMPSDVVGYTIYNKETKSFQYKKGVIMCNLFLADEINRTSSKTQSALLEAMEEGKVTIDGTSMTLPQPFTVIATQNPVGSAGTTLLPDSQLDRFMVRLSMGYPDKLDEVNILKSKMGGKNPIENIRQILSVQDIITIQANVNSIFVHDAMFEYIVELVNKTRNNEYIELGMSPRGTVALINMSKAIAYLSGRNYIVPEDVMEVFMEVSKHRIILSSKARLAKVTSEQIVANILATTKCSGR